MKYLSKVYGFLAQDKTIQLILLVIYSIWTLVIIYIIIALVVLTIKKDIFLWKKFNWSLSGSELFCIQNDESMVINFNCLLEVLIIESNHRFINSIYYNKSVYLDLMRRLFKNYSDGILSRYQYLMSIDRMTRELKICREMTYSTLTFEEK